VGIRKREKTARRETEATSPMARRTAISFRVRV
jgi:hypothetical protein